MSLRQLSTAPERVEKVAVELDNWGFEINKLHIKHKSGVGWDRRGATGRAICQDSGNNQHAPSPHFHTTHTLIPARDDHAAEIELQLSEAE